jgi:hypothetical protein
MSRRFLLLLTCTAAVVLCGAYIAYRTLVPQGETSTANSGQINRPVVTVDPRNASGQVAKVTSSPTKPANSGPVAIRDAFTNASDYAVFISDALKRPGEGGRFYAGVAYFRCMDIVAVPTAAVESAAADRVNDRRRSAGEYLRGMQSRCKAVPDVYPDQSAFRALLADSRLGQDPMLSAYSKFNGVKGVPLEVQIADLNRAVTTGDPLDIVMSIELVVPSIATRLVPDLSVKDHQELIYSAISAAACELSSTCATHILLLSSCVVASKCTSLNWANVQRQRFTGKEQALFDSLTTEIIAVGRGQRGI